MSLCAGFSLERNPEAAELFKKTSELMLLNGAVNIQSQKTCRSCDLHKTRKTIVWGEGLCLNGIMVVGEAPGYDEDLCGRPFMGTAGQTLRTLLQEEGVNPHHCRITNTVKCNPPLDASKTKPGAKRPGNRSPSIAEKQACWPHLDQEVEQYQPKAILAVGLTAAQNILGTKQQMAQLITMAGDSGIQTTIGGRSVMVFPCYHTSPLCVNRVPGAKDQIREAIGNVARLVSRGLGTQVAGE